MGTFCRRPKDDSIIHNSGNLTFYQFPASQHLSLRTMNIIERLQQEFRRRVKTQAALPNEGAVLRVFFGLWVGG